MEAGHGGTGSGIWTYTENLLRELDRQATPGVEILVLARRPQRDKLQAQFRRLKFVGVAWPRKGILARLLWVQVVLPLLCLFRRVDVLHKLATETPLWCPARRITTLHDFYYEFLFEHTAPEKIRWHEKLEYAYFRFVTGICFRKSARLIAVSDETRKEALRRYPGAAGRLVVIHHGVPPSTSGQLPSEVYPPPSASQPFRFLYPAKFMAHKGQLSAVAALEALQVQYPELLQRIQVAFRGYGNDNDYERRLRERVAASPAARHMCFVAYEKMKTGSELYAGFQGILFLTCYEGFGLPVTEAQAAGVAVICSDLPVLHEVAEGAALFVAPADPAAVAGAMRRLVENPAVYADLVAKGRRNSLRFTWENAARQTLDVYGQVDAPAAGPAAAAPLGRET